MVAAVISVVAPLLLLFGLKSGVVTQMRDQLTSQPGHLELRMIGSHALDQAWFTERAADARVGFVMPLTRALNTVGDLRASARQFLPDVELLPSGSGDPLLLGQAAPAGDQAILLSASAAERLAISVGDSLHLIVTRKREGALERLSVPMNVQGVLEPAVFVRPGALITLNLLTVLEDFRDGAQAPLPGRYAFDSPPAHRAIYPRARLYAASMDDVPALASDLQANNIDTVSRLADIEAVKAVDRLLGLVFSVIAWLGVAGCAASLVGAFAANIDRKRRDLAMLRLLGYGRGALLGYVSVQACLIAVVGFVVGLGLYAAASHFFDRTLGQTLAAGQYVSLLTASHIVSAFGLALMVALLVSLLGGLMAMRVQPSESLREV